MKTDETLIHAFQAGDKGAFDELAKKHLPAIYSFFLSGTGNEEDSEDLAQTALFKLYNNLGRFRFEASFTTYLYRINTNLLRNYFRKKKVQSLFSFMAEDDLYPDQSPSPGDNGIDNKRLWDQIASLPGKQRLVLILRLSQELPFRQIGEILNMKEGTAKVNYHHAINKLRTSLENK